MTIENHSVVIDPGSNDITKILHSIDSHILDYIILTHEHFDHVWGTDNLKQRFPNAKVVATTLCSQAIIARKKNMSVYYDGVGFELKPADIIIEDESSLEWMGIKLDLIPTPGHTPASMCIHTENIIFTGDTIIKEERTVTKLPGGDKQKLYQSVENLKERFGDENPTLYCGHGDHCRLSQIQLEKII